MGASKKYVLPKIGILIFIYYISMSLYTTQLLFALETYPFSGPLLGEVHVLNGRFLLFLSPHNCDKLVGVKNVHVVVTSKVPHRPVTPEAVLGTGHLKLELCQLAI